MEDIVVEDQDSFVRHRMEIVVNTEFKVTLTPKDNKSVYNLPMPIHPKEDLIVELAFMQINGIITVLPFSKYVSLIFAQKKSNGNLRPLADPRKNNTVAADDNTNKYHPVSTLSDAAQHMPGNSQFC